MFNKGALSLLSDYGDNSSDDEVPGPGVSTKRLHEDDVEEFHSNKVQRLPVPNIFLDNKVRIDHIDNPELHGGRLRTFAHERGNWATYVYVPYEQNEGTITLIDAFKKCSATLNLDVKKTDDFHISLTKTLILRHHWINPFVNSVKANMVHYKRFMILFDGLAVYCNEERTRTFIGLQIKTGYDSLLRLVEMLDKCSGEFNLPPFYKNPSFHMSIAWCVGDFEKELISILPQLHHQLQHVMDNSHEDWYIYVEYLVCKTGNKYFQFPLS